MGELHKKYTKCFSQDIVQKFFIIIQFALIISLSLLLFFNYRIFDIRFSTFCYFYIIINIFCSLNESDPAMRAPLRPRDLTTIFIVLSTQLFLAIFSASLFIYTILAEHASIFHTSAVLDESKEEQLHTSRKFLLTIITLDLFAQLMWLVYLSRFLFLLFPWGKPKIVYTNKVEENVVIEIDDEEDDESIKSIEILVDDKKPK